MFIYLFIYSFIMLIVIVNNYVTKMHSDLHAPSLHMSLHNFIYYECGQLLLLYINEFPVCWFFWDVFTLPVNHP